MSDGVGPRVAPTFLRVDEWRTEVSKKTIYICNNEGIIVSRCSYLCCILIRTAANGHDIMCNQIHNVHK